MIACGECRRLVNTDDEPDAFVEIGNMRSQTGTIVLCEPCRAEHEAEQDYAPWERDCSCRTPSVHSAMIDPPEPVLDRNCPVHGIDPDYELQKQRDDREIDF